ncbi:MAG TPA: cytochrome c4, partial [Burkholderiales bacterium]|nr:cytochrome c4 [Burkholderiales bacterium]
MAGPGTARPVPGIGRAVVLLAALCAGGAAIAQTGDAARGAKRAQPCGNCHGAPGRPPLAGTPALGGQQPEFLVLQMFLFREGLRDVPQMAGLFKGLSDRDLTDMAAHFSRQPHPKAAGRRDPALHARGAALSKSMGCGSCHLQDYSGQRQIPRLANQREDYLAASLRAYRDDQRTGSD